MVVVRRVLHGLGDPGGVGVPCTGPCSAKLPGTAVGTPLLPLGWTAALPPLDGDVPALYCWPGASRRCGSRGDGAGEPDGVLLLLLLNGVAANPALNG